MAKVELSIGRFSLAEPTLPSWVRILKCVEEKNAAVLEGIVAKIVDAPDDAFSTDSKGNKGFLASLALQATSVISAVPEIGVEIIAGCLRDDEGDLVSDDTCENATASDLMKVIQELLDQGVMNELITQAKNIFGPLWTKLLARARAQATATKSVQG